MFHMIKFGLNGLERRLKEREAMRRLHWLDDRMLADMRQMMGAGSMMGGQPGA